MLHIGEMKQRREYEAVQAHRIEEHERSRELAGHEQASRAQSDLFSSREISVPLQLLTPT